MISKGWIDPPALSNWASQMALVVKNTLPVQVDIGDTGSIPGSRRPPGGGPGNPLQYSCLESRGQGSP